MITNDVLKRLRFAVRMNDPAMLEMLALGGRTVGKEELDAYFLKDDEEGYKECPRAVLAALLDGMIIKYRGEKPDAKGTESKLPAILDNNTILKKIRIALELKEDDMMAIMRLADVDLSKNELSALFRKKGQKNYKECMDQFLRNFLVGLASFDLRIAR